MPPRALPPPLPASVPQSRYQPPRTFLVPVGAYDGAAAFEPPIRRYAMQWLQHAAARVHRRSEYHHRQTLYVKSVLGIDHLFDTSDVSCPPADPCRLRRRPS